MTGRTTPGAYRAPMRSRRDGVEPAGAVGRALRLGLCGIGAVSNDRDERRLERFVTVPDGSFVWTRSAEGFHLGRLTGPARVDTSPGAVAVDLVHVRPCDWLPRPLDAVLVPEQVRYAFSRGGRNSSASASTAPGRPLRRPGSGSADPRGGARVLALDGGSGQSVR